MTHSWGRFIAIFAIVALGVGFYAGLRMTAPDMRLSADQFYDATDLMDIRVASTLGLTDEDIEALRAIDGVEQVMAAYETDVMADYAGEPYAMRIHSLPYDTTSTNASDAPQDQDAIEAILDADGSLNKLVMEEGRWPEANDECLMSADRVMNPPLSIGDTITVTECSTGIEDTLRETEYTVVGLVHSSYYTSSTTMGSTMLGTGMLNQCVYVPQSDFAADYPITEAFITVEGAKALQNGSAEYDAKVDAVIGDIEAIASEREEARLQQIRSEAQEELDSSRADFERERDDALAQLDEAKVKLDEAESEIASSEQRIAQGEREYSSGSAQLVAQRAEGESQLAAAEQQIDDTRAMLASTADTLAATEKELEGAWQSAAAMGVTKDNASQMLQQMKAYLEMDPTNETLRAQVASLERLIEGQAAYDSGKAQYEDGSRQLEAAEATLASERAQARAQIAAAEAKLRSAKAELESGRAQLDEGRAQYESGLAEYEDERSRAEEELADAEQKLDDAQADIDAIERPEWLVMDRSKNYGAESFDMDAGRVDNIAMVFPFVFFLVAALVALTTMTRMVDEERMQIGTYKALGYARSRITSKYMIYAGVASLAGSIVGILLLAFTLPAIIMVAYSIVYIVPAGQLAIDWPIAIIATVLGVGITLAATAAAALSTLRESPAALMLPPAPKAGKRILLERIRPLWSHLSFLWKVTCRNIFRYKKRLFMTVIGIAGCTALLLTGFGLSDSINDIIDKHFGNVIEYNAIVTIDDEADDGERRELDELLAADELVGDTVYVQEKPMLAVGEGSELSVQVIVPEDVEALREVWNLRDRVTGEGIEVTGAGAVVTEKIATTYGLSVGDEVLLAEQDDMGNAKSDDHAVPITGIAENYVDHYVFLTSEEYAREFGEDAAFDVIYFKTEADEAQRAAMSESLRELGAVETVAFNDETIDTYRVMLGSVNMIVVVLIIAAALLAFIVLYNLTNINITERMREIATLKVLGFTSKEIFHYIFREILILSMIGALVGLGLGVFLENFVVTTAEVDTVMFGREIHAMSFVLAFLMTMLFTFMVTFVMRGKLSRIDMVESLKSNE